MLHLLGVQAIASGNLHACAILAEGSVSCWGARYQDGDVASVLEPMPVPGIEDAKAIAAGGFNTCAIQRNGVVKCTGNSIATELTEMPALRGAETLSIGSAHFCASFASEPESAVKCWGVNSRGQVGDGSTTDRALPVAVAFD